MKPCGNSITEWLDTAVLEPLGKIEDAAISMMNSEDLKDRKYYKEKIQELIEKISEAVNETYFENGVHPERGGEDNILKEAIHVAAVAVAFADAVLKSAEEQHGS